MPSFRSDGATFSETIARVQQASASWTDDDDNLYAWDGSAWQLIQPTAGTGAASGILPVENLAASNVDHRSADITWTNPAQTVQPTEVHVKIVEISSVWIVFDYPLTTFLHDALASSAAYQVVVKLVRRVGGAVVGASDDRSVFFTTAASPVPVGAPDPGGIGPGGTGTTVLIPPGAYDGVGTCSTAWELQSTVDMTTILTADSGTDLDFVTDPITGDVTLDNSAFAFAAYTLYRERVEETCDAVPEGWLNREWYTPRCDPFPDTAAPYDDVSLELLVPRICATELQDDVTETELAVGPAFGSLRVSDGMFGLVSGAAGGVIAYGEIAGLADYGSASIEWRGVLNADGGARLNSIPGMRIDQVDGSTGWYPKVGVTTVLGDEASVTDVTLRTYGTDVRVHATYDATTGILELFVNGTSIGSASVEEAANRANAGTGWYAELPAASYLTVCAAWASVLAAGGGGGPTPMLYAFDGNWDSSDLTTITTGTQIGVWPPVTLWADKAPGSHDAVGSGGAGSGGPSDGYTTINDLHAIGFHDGTQAFTVSGFPNSTVFTHFIALIGPENHVGFAYEFGADVAAGSHGVSVYRSSGTLEVHVRGATRWNHKKFPVPDYGPMLLVIACDATGDITMRRDGAALTPSSAVGSGSCGAASSPSTFYMASRTASGNFGGVVFGELGFVQSAMSSADRDSVEAAMIAKWLP